MDVLHTGSVDGFCLGSSDSDFTRLATRIREAELVVYGFGERKTPEPFVAAGDTFVYTEILRNVPVKAGGRVAQAQANIAQRPERNCPRRRLDQAVSPAQPEQPQPPVV